MPKVYVASALANYEDVLLLQGDFISRDWEIAFDWASMRREEKELGYHLTQEDKKQLAASMVEGVLAADLLVLLAPGRRGAHVELGIAIGAGKTVVVVNTNPEDDISFYLAPGIFLCRLLEELWIYLEKENNKE